MTNFTNQKAIQILKEEQAKNDAFFAEMDAKIKAAQDNTVDEQIWTTPNQRRLIAAAPELLNNLKAAEIALTDFFQEGYPVGTLLAEIRTTILKAEG